MKRTLVARLDNAGDVLLTGPAVRAVAASDHRLTFVCGPRGEEAARALEHVDDVLVYAAPWMDDGGAARSSSSSRAGALVADAAARFVDDVRARAIDEAIVFTSFHQSPLPLGLLLRMAGVETVAAISDDFPGALLDVRHRIGECHEVERNLSLAATLGHRLPPGDDGRLRLRPSFAAPHAGAPEAPVPAREPVVVVHPGASVPARTLAPSAWAEAVEELRRAGFAVVVTGGPDERALTARVAGPARGGVHDLGGATSLRDLASIVARASCVVCGNTGPAHLAAAVGTPVVVAFAPTVPAHRWRPWGVPHVLLGAQDVACAGCRARACPLPVQRCLADVGPRDVVDGVVRALSDRDALHPPLVAAVRRVSA